MGITTSILTLISGSIPINPNLSTIRKTPNPFIHTLLLHFFCIAQTCVATQLNGLSINEEAQISIALNT
ncbi:uncharacterized protein G2W53_003660 [Senna tora]|uniref:Uncharacterized protein n=1 Tax=Senna tora TaxID=362788 RepID=A0A834XB39_9FABA|nr:uncharacterized protein G2W53_003660 [Senna tora]